VLFIIPAKNRSPVTAAAFDGTNRNTAKNPDPSSFPDPAEY